MSSGRGNSRGHGHGRGRGHGRSRDHSFHIPSRHASQTVILTEVWKHRTHGAFAIPSQSGLVPPSLPTSYPNTESPPPHQPQPDTIAETPLHLHSPTNADQSHNLDNFINSSEYQHASIHPRKVDHPDGPLRQTHQTKQRNQASTWMDQVIPMLFEPFMDLL